MKDNAAMCKQGLTILAVLQEVRAGPSRPFDPERLLARLLGEMWMREVVLYFVFAWPGVVLDVSRRLVRRVYRLRPATRHAATLLRAVHTLSPAMLMLPLPELDMMSIQTHNPCLWQIVQLVHSSHPGFIVLSAGSPQWSSSLVLISRMLGVGVSWCAPEWLTFPASVLYVYLQLRQLLW